MKASSLFTALGIIVFFASACEKEPSLDITTPTASGVELSSNGASGTVTITANHDWTATPSESWVTVTPTSGKASDKPVKITISAGTNKTYEERTATVTITAGDLTQAITVRQEANVDIIVPAKSFELASDATSFEVEIESNVNYTVSFSSDWIRLTGTKGLKTDKLTFSVDANDTYDARSAQVTITPDNASLADQTVSITQAQKDAILLVDKSFDMPYCGGEIEVTVQANVDFEVKSAVDWIQHVGTKSLKSSVIRLHVNENMNDTSREGTVSISQKGGSIKHTVTVRQSGYISVNELSLDKTSLELAVGDMEQLTATIKPDNATDKAIKWSSDKPAVASVDAGGVVTATTAGSATITAQAGGKTATCTVTVEERVIQTGETTDVPEQGGTVEVDIMYNADYTVEVEEKAQSWLTYIQTRAVSNGKMQFQVAPNDFDDIRKGKVIIRDKAGLLEPLTIYITQASKMRRLLMKLYEALDGPHWTNNSLWLTAYKLKDWAGVSWTPEEGVTSLRFDNMGLKGEIPECIGEFTGLKQFVLCIEPGVTGTLPKSFSKLVNLQTLYIQNTSMTSLPDVFSDMTDLRTATITDNEKLTGPIPEGLGNSDKLATLYLAYNYFTGGVPLSWTRWTRVLRVHQNCLTGSIAHLARNREDFREFLQAYALWQRDGYGFDISDVEIPGFSSWIDEPVANTDGTLFTMDDVVKKSKYTVYLIWASWCPFSRTLMPAVKEYYQTYRQDGLEIIATSQVGGVDENGAGHMLEDKEGYLAEVVAKGYDQWYNFYWPDYGNSYLASTPNAEVYNSEGNVVFSSFGRYPDPVRQRYNKTASTDLIPFLETLFGPAEAPDPYASTDYSKDGQVLTLQKATVGKGINIVFMGDAYTDRDMGTGGVYEKVMKDAMEEFFAIEPYKTFRNRFNVYAVKVVSKNGRIGPDYKTALGTRFGSGTYVEGDDEKCFEYAMKVPGINSRENLLVSVLVNSNHNAGTAILYANGQCAVARTPSFGNDPDSFGSTLRHESGGHGFAFLADEYANYDETAPQSHIDYYNEVYNLYGWFSNVDFTNDPDKIRWSAFLKDSRYDGQVGMFEGAALYTYGAWRPTANSMMNQNMGDYNAPSRWAIYQQIMKRSGEDYSFEKFLEYDEVNRKAAGKAPLRLPANRNFEPGAPPVIIW